MKIIQRIISMILVVCLLLPILPTSAKAEEAEQPFDQEEITAAFSEDTAAEAFEEDPVPGGSLALPEAPAEEPTVEIRGFLPEESEEISAETQILPSEAAKDLTLIAYGVCGENLNWTLDSSGVLTVSGAGEMYDFSYGNYAPWYVGRGDILSVDIQSGVTGIGEMAFYDCANLASATIAEGITRIGSMAFANCNALTDIVIPKGITEISDGLFDCCRALRSVTLPEGLIRIGELAFGECDSLREIQLPLSLREIGNQAFFFTWLDSIYIPANVEIMDNPFYAWCNNGIWVDPENPYFSSDEFGTLYNKEKTELIRCTVAWKEGFFIADTVETVKESAFEYTYSFDSIVFPEGVTAIERYVFANCYDLQQVTIPGSISTIAGDAFWCCDGLTDIYYLGTREEWEDISITGYDSDPFAGITIHFQEAENELPAIPQDAQTFEGNFYKVYNLPGHTWASAREYCEDLGGHLATITSEQEQLFVESLTGGRKNLWIGGYRDEAFNWHWVTDEAWAYTNWGEGQPDNSSNVVSNENCLSIWPQKWNDLNESNIHEQVGFVCEWEAETEGDGGSYGESLTWKLEDGVLTVSGAGQMDNYSADNHAPWYPYREDIKTVVILKGVTSIGDYAFVDCTRLNGISIPEGVTSIGDYAFRDCYRLTDISIPEGVMRIGEETFYGCEGLTNINIPEGITSIGERAFLRCKSLTNISIPEGVTSIGEAAFAYCRGLTGISIPEGVTSIGDAAFECCTSLTGIRIPESVTSIGYAVFNLCQNMTSISIPESITSIGGRAFSFCSNLTDISIPEGVKSIGKGAFYECINLTDVYFPGTEETWNAVSVGIDNECLTNAQFHFQPQPHIHSYTGQATAATCTEKGYVTYTCDCGDSYTDDYTEPLGHNEVTDKAVEHDCTNTGLTEGSHCDRCSTVLKQQEVVPAKGHSYEAIVTDPTCTERGYTTYTCHCGHSYTDNFVDASGHQLGQWTVIREATCVEEGEEERTCSACDYRETNLLPKVPHSYETVITAPTCTEQGYTTYTCACGHSYTDNYLEAPGHRMGQWTVIREASCTEEGEEERNCSACDYRETNLLPKLPHSYEAEITAPTCTEEGYTTHTCHCGDSYRDAIIPPAGHVYGEWEPVEDAKCALDGSEKRICTVCQEQEIRVIHATGHSYESVMVPPTCTGQGCTVYTCSVCGENYADTYVDALGHSFGDWTVVKEATVLNCGLRSRFCQTCSLEETEEIGKTEVDIESDSRYGLAHFTVLDALTLKPVSGAGIFISTETDGEITLITDGMGKVSQILPTGTWSASVYAEGYLTRNLKITVKPGEQQISPIGISDKPMVDATITTREMTYEEIVAAGIDVENGDNKHFYEYKVEIRFHEELDVLSLISYGDNEGNVYIPPTNEGKVYYALSHDGQNVDSEPVTVIHSGKYGTYIPGRSTYGYAEWSPTAGDTIAFENGGYYFEGYGIPSALTFTQNLAFPENGWTYDAEQDILCMSVGERVHYLTYRDDVFCTVSARENAVRIGIFERIPADGYPTEADYVYIPTDELKEGRQYLLVQLGKTSVAECRAMSHDEDRPKSERVTFYADDVYGEYIVDDIAYENAVWLSASARGEGLKIVNNHYYAQVDKEGLHYMPLANENGWVLEDGYLSTTVEGKTFYLRYSYGSYHVTTQKELAGQVRLFEKTSATDMVSGSGQTVTKTIYCRTSTFEPGKEYIIVGSAVTPGGGNGGGGGGGGGRRYGTKLSDGTPVAVHKISEQFYLIIYGEVSWLKEMFEVEMLILNHSSTDTIENCVAELILPEGLSMAAMAEGEQSAVQTVDKIPENGSESVRWYVRGDVEGSYDISATLSGTMMPFAEDFCYEYKASSAIQVYAGNAMKMTFHIPEAAYKNQDYTVKIELENVSDKVLYGVTHTITGWEQGKITYYSDGREVRHEYGSGGTMGSVGTDAFYPGDKIVVELSFEILFESTIIKRLLSLVDQEESLYQSCKAVINAYNLMETVLSFSSSANYNLDGILADDLAIDNDKWEAVNTLLEVTGELCSKLGTGNYEALELANEIQSSEAYEFLKSCADISGCKAFLAGETAANILYIAGSIRTMVRKTENTEQPYNAFDAMRTIVTNLPIRFVVDSVMVSAMEDSATTIPYSVQMAPVPHPRMGVDNWGKLFYSLMISTAGKIETPWYAQLFGVPGDITGYEEAVSYVKQEISQIEGYSVYKGAGTRFNAWIERAQEVKTGEPVISTGSADDLFLIETDNDTAVYENGVLSFVGNAVLEVTPLSETDGILCIRDDEGNEKRIVIDVVQSHVCGSDSWKVELAPSEEYDGYRVKRCDICEDVLAVESLSSCYAHAFGEWTVEQEATEEFLGLWYRECRFCHTRENKFTSVEEELPDVQELKLERSYIRLKKNESIVLSATVLPVERAQNLEWLVEEGGESILFVDENGKITAGAVGTAYVIASVSDGETTLTARCRVDVAEDLTLDGVQLNTTKATTELYSTDYVQLEILLQLPQNYARAMNLRSGNGIAIREARFVDEDTAAVFDLVAADDRHLLVVPKAEAIAAPGSVQASYESAVAVTVGEREYTTGSVKLTVKKTLPKLKAAIDSFNSFYSGQSNEIQINGATVTDIRPEGQLPDWLSLEEGFLVLTENAPQKSTNAKVSLLVDTEEWSIPAAVTLNVKNAYKAPALKLSASTVTFASDAENSVGVSMALQCRNKKEALSDWKVTGITAPEGYSVSNFDPETGTFTLKAEEGFRPGKITLEVQFADTDNILPLKVTVKSGKVNVKLAKTTVTLNAGISDSVCVPVTVTPGDYRISGYTLELLDARQEGQLAYSYENGCIIAATTDTTEIGAAYKLRFTAAGKSVNLTVKTNDKAPEVTLKASGQVDLSFPEKAAVVTASFKNYSGKIGSYTWTVAESKGKTLIDANAAEKFQITQNGNTFELRAKEGAELDTRNTYMLTLKLTLANGLELPEKTVKLPVKNTSVKLKLSKNKLTLNKLVSDSASVTVTCTTKGYPFTAPSWEVTDSKGAAASEALKLHYEKGTLTVALGEGAAFGSTYKVLLKANEYASPMTLTVTVPTEAKSKVTVTLKASGTLDVIRDGSTVTVTPSYKNVTDCTQMEEQLLIYSSADKYAESVNHLFSIRRSETGAFLITKAEGAALDHTRTYKVQLVTVLGDTVTAESKQLTLKVKMGSAKLTAAAEEATLFGKDKHDRLDFSLTSRDETLNEAGLVTVKDAKYKDVFEIHSYGNGRFAIGFKDGKVDSKLLGKTVTLTLNVTLDGNESGKINTTVKLKLTVIK